VILKADWRGDYGEEESIIPAGREVAGQEALPGVPQSPTADKWIAKIVCEKIEATGATSFRDDRDIAGGDDIPEEIRRQIRQSKEMVVLLTPASVEPQWVTLGLVRHGAGASA
jgi:TIR domain